MNHMNVLPWPRGEYGCQGDTSLINLYDHLLGQEFTIEDNTVAKDGTAVTLRVVKNGNASDITAAHKFYKFDNEAGEFGRVIDVLNNVAGGVAVPLDYAYTVGSTWTAGDYAYVVVKGWNYITSEAGTMNLAAHDAIASDNAGCVNGAAAAAGETVLGTIDQASTAESTDVLCWVDINLNKSDPSG